MTKTVHIIVAAGTGSRFGADVPKQFCTLRGLPVVMHTINRFRQTCPGDRIVLVLSSQMTDFWHELCAEYSFDSPETVAGGATRWHSVKNAIDSACGDADIITVHDGARPLVSAEVIHRVLDALETTGAVIPAVPVTDSLRIVTDGSNSSVDRALYRAVQTPQAFDGNLLRRAYSAPFSPAFTDDASVAESYGAKIAIVDGDPTNIKITHPRDLAIAGIILDGD
ncbi:MAG: 2-C-methyl-D-erythritol 4-phosphate cytidylyltransferase [Paramuribaculum sp.]|nr:2-C-methyl-D-erythritol 4-phosphate cytidylyltransferase [Paramuribaculum sp.]